MSVEKNNSRIIFNSNNSLMIYKKILKNKLRQALIVSIIVYILIIVLLYLLFYLDTPAFWTFFDLSIYSSIIAFIITFYVFNPTRKKNDDMNFADSYESTTNETTSDRNILSIVSKNELPNEILLKNKLKNKTLSRFLTIFLYINAALLTFYFFVDWLFFYDQFIVYLEYGIPLLIVFNFSLLFIWYFAKNSHKILGNNFTSKIISKSKRIFTISFILLIFVFNLYQPTLIINSLHIIRSPSYETNKYETLVNPPFLAINSTFYQSGFIFQPHSIPGGASVHASKFVILPNGDIFAVWFGGSGEKQLDVKIFGCIGHLQLNTTGTEMAIRWEKPFVSLDTPNRSEGPGPIYLLPDGRILLFYMVLRPNGPMFGNWGPEIKSGWSVAKIMRAISEDNGKTWHDKRPFKNRYFYIAHGSILKTSDGNLILPAHREAMQYQATYFWTKVGKNNNLLDPTKPLNWIKGPVWSTPKGCLEPEIIQLINGDLMAFLRTLDGRVYKSISKNSGLTWSIPEEMRFPNPNSAVGALRLKDGRIILMLNPQTNNRDRLSLILGDPTGTYWSEPVDIVNSRNSSAEYSYPILKQLDDDSIVFLNTNNRTTIQWGRFTLEAINNIEIIKD